MNLCTNCKFHESRTDHEMYYQYTTHLCNRTGRIDPVNGKRVERSSCDEARGRSLFGNGQKCGPEGKHFEAKA